MESCATVLAASAVWVVLWSSPVLAHAGIVERLPEEGAALENPPDRVRLLFNEPVEAAFNPLEVYGPGGERVDEDNARVDPENPDAVVVDLREGLPGGTYEVRYRISSTDGHPVDGSYEFRASAAAEDRSAAAAGEGAAEEPAAPAAPDEDGFGTGGTIATVGGIGLVLAVVLGFVLLRRG